jgi:hypothetical protein
LSGITVPNNAGNQQVGNGPLVVTITAPSVGSILLACIGLWDTVTGISGGGVTTWSAVPGMAFTGDVSHNDSDIWWGSVDGTPGTSVTISRSGGTSRWLASTILEISGAAQTLDTSVAFANDASGTTDSKSITTGTDGSIIVSIMDDAFSGTPASTGPTGYTTLTRQTDGGSALLQVAYLVKSPAGSSTMNWTGLVSGGFPSLGAVALVPSGPPPPIVSMNMVELSKMRPVGRA